MTRIIALAAALAAVIGASPAPSAGPPARFTDQIVGQGPDLILIPGLACSRAVWDAEAAKLKTHWRLHLIQVRGFGGEPAGPNATGPVLQPVVDELHQYIESRGLTGATVIGHSLGGTMGLLLAEQHPADVRRLMIVDALPFYSVLMAGPSATPASVEPMAAALRDRIRGETQAAYAAGEGPIVDRLVKSPAGRAQALAMAQASDHAVVAQALYDDMTADARPGLAAIKAEVTMLYPWDASTGAPQAAFDQLYHGAYAALPGVRLARVDGSDHFIMYDQPEAFDREVQAFLAR